MVQPPNIVTTNHEGVAQQERIVYGDAGGYEDQPATSEYMRPTKQEREQCRERYRCAERDDEPFAVNDECRKDRHHDPHQGNGCNHGDRGAQEMTALVTVCSCLCVRESVSTGKRCAGYAERKNQPRHRSPRSTGTDDLDGHVQGREGSE